LFRKGGSAEDSEKQPVFVDLADYPVTDTSGDKRVKVLRPTESADLRSLKSYILSRITVIVDLTFYTGDTNIAGSIVRDSVSECGGNMWTVNPSVLIAAPFDVEVDNGE